VRLPASNVTIVLSAEQQAFVRGPYIAVLATVDASGEPRAVPMWYVFDGSRFLMVTRNGSQKHRDLERHPTATVVIDHRTRPYYALMIRCTAEIDAMDVDLVRSRTAARYLTEPELSAYVDSRRGSDSVVIRLEPVSIAVYGDTPPT